MDVQIRDADALRRVSLEMLSAYLESRGWTQGEVWRDRIQVWSSPVGQSDKEILMPLSEQSDTYALRIAEAIDTLSSLEERSQTAIYDDLMGNNAGFGMSSHWDAQKLIKAPETFEEALMLSDMSEGRLFAMIRHKMMYNQVRFGGIDYDYYDRLFLMASAAANGKARKQFVAAMTGGPCECTEKPKSSNWGWLVSILWWIIVFIRGYPR